MKEMLLYEDANEIIIQGLKVEPQNADLKKLQVDVTKELASMRAKERKGPDGVSIILLFCYIFLIGPQKRLSPAEAAKEEGNDQFKNGMHEIAIRWYTRFSVLLVLRPLAHSP